MLRIAVATLVREGKTVCVVEQRIYLLLGDQPQALDANTVSAADTSPHWKFAYAKSNPSLTSTTSHFDG